MKNNLLLVCLLFLVTVNAQRIDNTVSYRDMGSDSYFRFHYDNDFFTAEDLYYTQGYTFELVKPWLEKNPVNIVLLNPAKSVTKYGLAFEQTGFTPSDITASEILYGDRPFAATIAIKSFSISTDTINKSQLTSSITLGMIGPAAFGNEIQTGIHKWIDDDIPQGWKYQINNDMIIDCELVYEKQLLAFNNFTLGSYTKVRMGTLNTNASAGLTIKLGIIDDAFSAANKKNFSVYLYAQPVATIVGYDASLQGGLFNTSSPYTIPASDIERAVLQNHFGLIVKYRGLYLEYSRAVITREFKTGHSHKWGGFRVGFSL
jgi:hypothetical protein